MNEKDLNLLTKWVKLAAKAATIQDSSSLPKRYPFCRASAGANRLKSREIIGLPSHPRELPC